jgi:hypothetical protein
MFQDYVTDLSSEFTLSSSGELRYYLGIEIDYDRRRGTLRLSQSKYVRDLLTRFDMQDCSPAPTPAVANAYLTGDDCIDRLCRENLPQIRHYQALVGALLYLSNWTRPDISKAVSSCSRFLAAPGPSHVVAAKRILRYLRGTSDLSICYTRSSGSTIPHLLSGYVDADHAGDPNDRLSVTGYMFFLNGGPISWCSKRQPIVAVSSTEAEYYAASQAGLMTVVLRRLLSTLGVSLPHPTSLLEDNAACIFMAHGVGALKRAKHIDVRVFKLRELVRDGVLVLTKVMTDYQVADILTKALPALLFERHRSVFLSRK